MLRKALGIIAAWVLFCCVAGCDDSFAGWVQCRELPDGSLVCTGQGNVGPEATRVARPRPPASPIPATSPDGAAAVPTSVAPAPALTTAPAPPPTPAPATPEPPAVPAVPVPTPEPTATPGVPDTAAERHGWGVPILRDEFDYTGVPDPRIWWTPADWGPDGCGPRDHPHGWRCASQNVVADGKLTILAEPNGKTGWVGSKLNMRYGRWEVRVRSEGTEWHPVIIIWPSSNQWPIHGEYDFWENLDPAAECAGYFMHYPHAANVPIQQEGGWCMKDGVDLTQWHNVAIEWTPDHVKGFLDGVEWFSHSNGAGPYGRDCIQCMPSGFLTIQLDRFGANTHAKVEVDWVRIYPIPGVSTHDPITALESTGRAASAAR